MRRHSCRRSQHTLSHSLQRGCKMKAAIHKQLYSLTVECCEWLLFVSLCFCARVLHALLIVCIDTLLACLLSAHVYPLPICFSRLCSDCLWCGHNTMMLDFYKKAKLLLYKAASRSGHLSQCVEELLDVACFPVTSAVMWPFPYILPL